MAASDLTPPRNSVVRARLIGTSAFRLTALIVAGFVLVATLVGGVLFWQTNDMLNAQTLRGLAEDQASYLDAAARSGTPALVSLVEQRAGPAAEGSRLVLLADANGHRIAGNIDRWPAGLDDKPQGGTFHYDATSRPPAVYDGSPPAVHYRGSPFAVGLVARLPDGSRLLVGRDLGMQQTLIERIRWLFLAGFGLLSLAGIATGLAASKVLLSRIAEVTDAGASIVAGDLSRRIPLSGSDDEFDHLATHLNAMLERIEQLMAAMREVTDNIAHDLKTPLSRLRSKAEAALRAAPGTPVREEGLARVIEDADAIIQTFNALLLIARLEAGAVEKSAEDFELGDLVRDVTELYEPVAEEAGQALRVNIACPMRIRANRQLIGQALANLIDNAIKYGTPSADGQPRVTVELAGGNGEARLSVGDRGPGIPEADRDRVARRFVRLDQSRSKPGTGLGLSLVAAVARLHGGRMLIEDNAPGLRVVLKLPADASRTGGEAA